MLLTIIVLLIITVAIISLYRKYFQKMKYYIPRLLGILVYVLPSIGCAIAFFHGFKKTFPNLYVLFNLSQEFWQSAGYHLIIFPLVVFDTLLVICILGVYLFVYINDR